VALEELRIGPHEQKQAGDSIELTVVRDGEKLSLTAQLETRPA